jgi:hypothetical protein
MESAAVATVAEAFLWFNASWDRHLEGEIYHHASVAEGAYT